MKAPSHKPRRISVSRKGIAMRGVIVMKSFLRKVVLSSLLFGGMMAKSEVLVTDVVAEPVSPWGGNLGLSFTVSGELPVDADEYCVCVVAKDLKTHGTWPIDVIKGDKSLSLGRRRVVCDVTPFRDVTWYRGNELEFAVHFIKPYCIVDLSPGPDASSYKVSYMADVPGIGSDGYDYMGYKTSKLVLRCIAPGSFIMGAVHSDLTHEVLITEPFYIGVFELTQGQWELVMGTNPCQDLEIGVGVRNPVSCVSYDMIRGSSKGRNWPTSSLVDDDSFMGKLRAKTELEFDLPTSAQWEFACRAGTITLYSYGRDTDGAYMWYKDNAEGHAHVVGLKLPNGWGLYDMHGNVAEWCLDLTGAVSYGCNPVGPSSDAEYKKRVVRGGEFFSRIESLSFSSCWDCHSDAVWDWGQNSTTSVIGFRVAMKPSW